MDQDEFSFDSEGRGEGAFEYQLSLPLPTVAAPQPFQTIVKRDGREEPFDRMKIAEAIFQAAQSIGGQDADLAASLANGVAIYLTKRMSGATPHVDHVHDAVERVLIHMSHVRTALAYARYRDRRARIRRLREGDMGHLLGELEEARIEREALGGLGDKSLFVRTSTDMVTSWDRRRIVEALVRETELDEKLATVIALEVEEQVKRGPITTLTTSLVRELVGAKLVEHGLDEYRERHRRLGVPVYDADRIIRGTSPASLGRDPEGTGLVLAEAVKKEYALTEVFSPAIAEGHLRGDFHLHHLGAIDRIASGTGCLGHLAEAGITLPNGATFDAPPENASQLLAQMMRLGDMLGHLAVRGIAWESVNTYFAPFLAGLSAGEIRGAAQMIVYEHAYRCLAGGKDAGECLQLCWTAPRHLAERPVLGEQDFSALDHQIQQLAWDLVDVVRAGGAGGGTLPAPAFEVVLDERFWDAPGHESFLGALGETAGAGRHVYFRLERGGQTVPDAEEPARPRPVLHEITLNLPRAALETGKPEAFLEHVTRLAAQAERAHGEKVRFLEGLLARGGDGPLALAALLGRDMPGLDLGRGECRTLITGLDSAVRCLVNAGPGASAEAASLADQVLACIARECERASVRTGLRIVAGALTGGKAGHRFITLDMGRWPKAVAALFQQNGHAVAYSEGVAVAADPQTSPFEQLRLEGSFHRHLTAPALAHVRLPAHDFETPAIADLLRKAYFQSQVEVVRFHREEPEGAASCPSP